MPQIIQITSEAIQAQIRRLLPSQQGFGIDMEASSVITPIIDVTPAAEGSQLPSSLQQAMAYGDNTAFFSNNSTNDIVSTPGFYRIVAGLTVRCSSSAARAAKIQLFDGSTAKTIYATYNQTGINNEVINANIDLIVYLRSGDKLRIATDTGCAMQGSTRQIADVYGNLVNPSGFTFE